MIVSAARSVGRDRRHVEDLDRAARLLLDPGWRLVAAVVGLRAGDVAAKGVGLEVLDAGEGGDQLLAREVWAGALQRLDQHLRAADAKQVEHGQPIAGELRLD